MASWRNVMDGQGYAAFDSSSSDLNVGSRPALLVIDIVTAFLGGEGLTLEESIAQWPLSCGPAGWESLPKVQELIGVARSSGIRVIYTTGNPGVLGGATKSLVDTRGNAQADAMEIPESISPLPGEQVFAKSRPSAFFGTPLAALLVQQGIDSLIVAGCTTSGCVRATVVDGHSMGWPMVIAEEATFDRAELSHDVSLFEMNAKYGTVATVQQITQALSPGAPK